MSDQSGDNGGDPFMASVLAHGTKRSPVDLGVVQSRPWQPPPKPQEWVHVPPNGTHEVTGASVIG